MYYIIRHGQTEKNKQHVLQGRINVPLNDEGRRQASAVRDYFREKGIAFDQVYSSPLDRAVETAMIVSGCGEPVRSDLLLEMDYGPYEGTDLKAPPKEIITFFKDFVHNPAPEGMESLQSVKNRAFAFLEAVKDTDEHDILISTHAIAMKGVLEVLTPEAGGYYWSKTIQNCEVYCFEYRNGRYTVPVKVDM